MTWFARMEANFPAKSPVGTIPQAPSGHALYEPFYREENRGSRRWTRAQGHPRSPGRPTLRPCGPGPLRHQLPRQPPPLWGGPTPTVPSSPHTEESPPQASFRVTQFLHKLRCGLCGCGGGVWRRWGSRSIPRSPQDLCPYPPHSAPASVHRSSWFQRRPRRTYRMWPGQGGLGQSRPQVPEHPQEG